ncbi:pyruvate formate lyase family protein [Nitrosomonas aestuarii]|uniref:pyruvate formate lyase family protein n=1 Tax=Nitrosomonas aestuarii TaxID=52441 RepID=UPI000D324375|nr:pyruvate formate lyase family protein [Nitrosomonas aestuarii]PTN11301.1 cobalamin-independent glycerol dehydratase large subunit [Nitrosomonas aestuarii]
MQTSNINRGGIHIDLEHGTADTAAFNDKTASYPIPNDAPDKIRTLNDLTLSHISLSDFPVVQAWRNQLFDPEWIPEVCDELPRLLTEFLRKPKNDALPPITQRSQALKHIFSHKTPFVKKSDLLPGQTTTSFVGPVVHMDMSGYCIWPELDTIATRSQNPFKIKPKVAKRFNEEIFPFWLERRTVQEVARYSDYDTADYANDQRDTVDGGMADDQRSIDPPLKKRAGETPKCQELFERVAFYLTDKATAVSHTAPDFGRILNYGMDALIAQLRQDIANGSATGMTVDQKEFAEAVIAVYEGAKIYAEHLAEAAGHAGNNELARICRRVPAKPAKTLAEALTAVWICYHLLLQENTNFGLSPGRLDQTLNDFYLNDWQQQPDDEAKAAYTKHAVELMCHFFLRCSDHVPLSPETAEVLFAGSGSNQALTVGGTRYVNGKTVDAVNDMTYIILKATEMLSIRDPNVHARYHKDVHHRAPDDTLLGPGEISPYLKRICQVNLITRATPALHGDVPVIHSMANYYARHDHVTMEEALTDAHDYASIGCIEQNSDHKHYGHTGSTLLVLPAVLELAMFGGKHRSDGIGRNDPNLFYGKTEYTSSPLNEMDSMQQFIDSFRFQLDEMARHCVQFNNYLGRTLAKVRPSPLLSGLFDGPTNIPGGHGAKFRDLSSGGAKYNSSGVAIIGLADVIDSFCVIDALVFGGKMTADELVAALNANFDPKRLPANKQTGFLKTLIELIKMQYPNDRQNKTRITIKPERLQECMDLIRVAPKYGAGVDKTPGGIFNNAMAVKYTHLLTRMIQDVFFKYRTHRGGRYLTGYWSMTNHAGFGMLCKATPNGRLDNASFASGITPCPGIVKANGEPVMLLDHMLSVASVNPDTVQNGYTYNLSLTPRGKEYFNEDTDLFATYMKTFMDQDGVLVQLCVTSIEDFIAADKAATAASQTGAGEAEQKALAPYKDLMIRVAGYSAYYVTLSPQMRQEIIDRANFGMESGIEQHEVAGV